MSLRLIASSQDCPPSCDVLCWNMHTSKLILCTKVCLPPILLPYTYFLFPLFFATSLPLSSPPFLPQFLPSVPFSLFLLYSTLSLPPFPSPPIPLPAPCIPTPVSSRVSRRRSDSTHTCSTRTLSATVEQGVRMESSRSSWSRSLEVCVVQYRLLIICMCIHSISLHDILNCILSYKRKE